MDRLGSGGSCAWGTPVLTGGARCGLSGDVRVPQQDRGGRGGLGPPRELSMYFLPPPQSLGVQTPPSYSTWK